MELFNKENEVRVPKKKSKVDVKKVTLIVVWSLVYAVLAGLVVFSIVYGIGYALLDRNNTGEGLKWVIDIRAGFNAWRGEKDFVDISTFVTVFIILSTGILVGVILAHDNYLRNKKRKSLLTR
ncbi:MAG: hypothetical protein LBM99_00825 [Bacillales bacterium]|jgi:hypothetical protein|nr:hypothetical protein [Bacillales bacterium]